MLKWFMLAVYIMVTTYILWRSLHCIDGIRTKFNKKPMYAACIMIFVFLCATLLLGGLMPYGTVSVMLHKFSNVWLGLFLYLFTFIIFADIVVFIIRRIHKKHPIKLYGTSLGHAIVVVLIVVLSAGTVIYGTIHSETIVTNQYEITIDKDGGAIHDLNVVLISDFHLGYAVGCSMMEDMVEKVNALEPDLIIVAGDILDNEYEALEDPKRLAEILRGLKSTYGVYAVYGNHDVAERLIGGFSITPAKYAIREERMEQFVEDCNFYVLKDESILIADSFYLTGRLDAEKAGDGTKNREDLEDLIDGFNFSKPVFMIAHEPEELDEYADAGVDVFFGGHTHAGQFFPLTVVQPFVWDNYWGHKEHGKLHSFVSSGIGVYGPKLRVFTDSEIMQIKVHFAKEKE